MASTLKYAALLPGQIFMALICRSKPRNYSSSSSALQTLSNVGRPIPNPLYNFLPEINNPNPKNVISLVCSSLRLKDLRLWDYLEEQGLFCRFTCYEFSKILLRSQSDPSAALIFFNWVKSHLGLKPSAHNYCIIIHTLVWTKNYKQAMKILLELVQLDECGSSFKRLDVYETLLLCTNDCNSDPIVFDMLIKAYLRKGMILESFHVFRKTVKIGFVPSIFTANCLLNVLSKTEYVGKCWEIYEEMLRIDLCPNLCTFNILTYILCKEGDLDKVNDFLERMDEEGLDPDVVTYNMLIDVYCQKRSLKDAVYIYNIMCKRGLDPDLITYTTLMKGLCRGCGMKEAHRLFNLMVHKGLKPDAVSYNTLMYGYSKAGMMQEARSLLFDMIDSRVWPDKFTCWLLIKGYQNLDRMISAMNLVVELARYGVKVPQDIYSLLMLALCEENRPFAAKTLFEQMSKNGFVPSEELYNELIGSLCRCKFVKEALKLKVEMTSKDLKPNLIAYRAIIEGLCESSRSVEALPFMQEMVDSGSSIDIGICRSVMNGLCKDKNILEAESLLRFYAKEFQILDIVCYNTLIRILSEECDPSQVIKFQDRMVKIGYVPNSLTCKHVIDGMWKTIGTQRHELDCSGISSSNVAISYLQTPSVEVRG